MKRVLVIALAIVCGMACSDCFAKKPKKVSKDLESPSKSERFEVTRYEETKDAERARMELELKMAELEREMRKPITGPLLVEMELPCQEEAKSTDEYYAAFGASCAQRDPNYAFQDATRKAKMDLTKQIGGGEVTLDNVEIVCKKLSRTESGDYKAYVAVRMPKNR